MSWQASPPCPFPLPVKEHVLLSSLSTLRLGGPARYYASVSSAEDLATFLCFCHTHRVRYLVLGKGSNCLFETQGFAGLVLHNAMHFLEFLPEHRLHVSAGYSFSHLGTQVARQNLSGLEFAAGIPASVGGAIFMNAGAHAQETKDALESVTYLFPDGQIKTLPKEALEFGYRSSIFQKMAGIILSAHFRCHFDKTTRQRQRDLLAKRLSTQPLNQPSAGCIFANPPSPKSSAGALIDQAGLKGYSIGGVSVSTLHANFLVNLQGGTSEEMKALIEHVHTRVHLKTGVDLKREVRYIAFNEDPLT